MKNCTKRLKFLNIVCEQKSDFHHQDFNAVNVFHTQNPSLSPSHSTNHKTVDTPSHFISIFTQFSHPNNKDSIIPHEIWCIDKQFVLISEDLYWRKDDIITWQFPIASWVPILVFLIVIYTVFPIVCGLTQFISIFAGFNYIAIWEYWLDDTFFGKSHWILLDLRRI